MRKNLKKIVGLGPNADNENVQLGNYNGFLTDIVTPLQGIRAKVGTGTEVVYRQGVDYAINMVYEPLDINKNLAYNGQLVLDFWTGHGVSTNQHVLNVTAGKKLNLKLEYFQTDRRTILKFTGAKVVPMNVANILAKVKDADATLFVSSISPKLEGEEMNVKVPGFSGGDRTTIGLPQVQADLLKVLHSTGKPVVLA